MKEDRKDVAMWHAVAAKSYLFLRGDNDVHISPEALDQPLRVNLPYQPFGSGCDTQPSPEGGLRIRHPGYFEPMIPEFDQVVVDDTGLHFKVNYIRGADFQTWGRWDRPEGDSFVSVRLAPEVRQPAGAVRAQMVHQGPRDYLWLMTNGRREFFVYVPSPRSTGDRWMLVDSVPVPQPYSEGEKLFIHGTLLEWPFLYTVESPKSLKEWRVNKYEWQGGEFIFQNKVAEVPPWFYGPYRKPGDDALWYVTDVRVTETEEGNSYLQMVQRFFETDATGRMMDWDYKIPKTIPKGLAKPGIYREKKLVVPGVFGNNLAFLPNGGFLLFVYTPEFPGPLSMAPHFKYIPPQPKPGSRKE